MSSALDCHSPTPYVYGLMDESYTSSRHLKAARVCMAASHGKSSVSHERFSALSISHRPCQYRCLVGQNIWNDIKWLYNPGPVLYCLAFHVGAYEFNKIIIIKQLLLPFFFFFFEFQSSLKLQLTVKYAEAESNWQVSNADATSGNISVLKPGKMPLILRFILQIPVHSSESLGV